MLALYPGRYLLHHKGIKNDQTIFFYVTGANVKFAVSQTLIHSIFCTKRDYIAVTQFQKYCTAGWKKFLETPEYWSIKKHLISCRTELLSKNCCWQAGVYS